jgi:hypothetical protein
MIFFDHYGRKSERENPVREALLIVLMAVLALVLLPFTILLALFWLVWDLTPGRA